MSVQILKLTNGTFLIADRLFSADRAISNHAPIKLKNVLVIKNNGEFNEKQTALMFSQYLPFAEDGIVQLFEDQIESFAEANKALLSQYEDSSKRRFA